jgi:hypothetical protein
MASSEDIKKKIEEDKASLAADIAALEASPAPEPATSQEPAQAAVGVSVFPAEPATAAPLNEVVIAAVAAADLSSAKALDAATNLAAYAANVTAAHALFSIGQDGGLFYQRAQQHLAASKGA